MNVERSAPCWGFRAASMLNVHRIDRFADVVVHGEVPSVEQLFGPQSPVGP